MEKQIAIAALQPSPVTRSRSRWIGRVVATRADDLGVEFANGVAGGQLEVLAASRLFAPARQFEGVVGPLLPQNSASRRRRFHYKIAFWQSPFGIKSLIKF